MNNINNNNNNNELLDALDLEPLSYRNKIDLNNTEYSLIPFIWYNLTIAQLKDVVFSLDSKASERNFYIFNCNGECIFDSGIRVDGFKDLEDECLNDTLSEWKNEMLYACEEDSVLNKLVYLSFTYYMLVTDKNIFPDSDTESE